MAQKRPRNGLEYLLDDLPALELGQEADANGGAKPPPAHVVEIEDTRRHSRRALEFDVEFERDNEHVPARGSELSRGGMFVATRRALPKGDVVSASIFVAEHTIKIIAEVIWERGDDPTGALDVASGMGLKFLDIDDGDADFVDALVASYD